MRDEKFFSPSNTLTMYFQMVTSHQSSLILFPSRIPLVYSNMYMNYSRVDEQETPLDLSFRRKERSNYLRNEKKLFCEACGKFFDRPSLLKRHIRTHTGEKPHACSVCGKKFSTSSSLNTHTRIHTGERPHECSICGKRFTASSNLYYHRMTHYKEKPHKCNDCGKSFPTPGDLRSHSYSHSGNWPFRCSICGRGFCKPGALHHHAKVHNDRSYYCKDCPKHFSTSNNLRLHEQTHIIRPIFEIPNMTYSWTPWMQ